MPLYLDIHEVGSATAEDIAEAHNLDLAVQDKYGVNYIKYWFNQDKGKVFCLCSAPDPAAAERVHREAHGLVADRVIEVDPEMAEGMLGGGIIASSGAVTDADGTLDPGLRVIMFTDIVGSTELTQRLGDHLAMQIVDLHDRVVRMELALHRGREVKHLGDGMMAVFRSAEEAVRCAEEVHHRIAQSDAPEDEKVLLRVGVAAGDPVERNGDFFGSTVQLAARLCATADPGGTMLSSSVTELCVHRSWESQEVTLKGFEDPVLAFAL